MNIKELVKSLEAEGWYFESVDSSLEFGSPHLNSIGGEEGFAFSAVIKQEEGHNYFATKRLEALEAIVHKSVVIVRTDEMVPRTQNVISKLFPEILHRRCEISLAILL